MIEKDFKDRIPTYPGRIEIIPVEGKPNTYTMKRADEPLEEGTPVDKATFESIIQSRLTGRYYNLAANATIKRTASGAASPLPSSNWVVTANSAISGAYKVEASSYIGADYSVEKAVDGKDSTNWGSLDNTTHYYSVIFPIAIKIKKLSVNMGLTGDYTGFKMIIQGSNNNTSWTNLHTVTTFPNDLTTYTLSQTGDYKYYRLYFEKPDGKRVYIDTLSIDEWEANTYTIDFRSDDMPGQWDIGQRVTVQIPTYAAFVIDSNTLNNIKVNTILLSEKRYELRYNGTTFDAKEL